MILPNENIKLLSKLEEILISEDVVLTNDSSYYPLDWDRLNYFDKIVFSKLFDVEVDEWNCVNIVHNTLKDEYYIIVTEFDFDWHNDIEYKAIKNYCIKLNQNEIGMVRNRSLTAIRI